MSTTRLIHKFNVRQAAGAPLHGITIFLPSAQQLSEKQRAVAWENAVDGIVIKIQGALRRAIGKGVRGEALDALAQRRFDEILNGATRAVASVVVVDAKAGRFTPEQVALLKQTGATVINADWAEAEAEEEELEAEAERLEEENVED